MSSRCFKAQTGHSTLNPQLCGLTGNPIQKGDWCFYLVCDGRSARPEYQVVQVDEVEYTDRRGNTRTRKVYESQNGRPFRCVFTGEWESYTKANGKKGRRRVYEWQVEGPDGQMFPVDVWSNMVHASAARKLGYHVPNGKCIARKGERTRGAEHRVAKEAENPLITIAKAVLDDEEAGLVAPLDEQADALFPTAVGDNAPPAPPLA